MKVVILAGGLGTRLAEETQIVPKPMVRIGNKPIVWHIMSGYAARGFTEFVLALGYKGEVLKDYFINSYSLANDVSVDLASGETTVHDGRQPDWRVHLVHTGSRTMTGGRLKRLKDWIGNETFMMTYGDGLSDVDAAELLAFHKKEGRLATVTAARPPARFGGLAIEGTKVARFAEKPQLGEGWINAGYFVLEPGVFDYISGDDAIFERSPLERLAAEGRLSAFRHAGFWQPMDTIREKNLLDELWRSGKAPWKIW